MKKKHLFIGLIIITIIVSLISITIGAADITPFKVMKVILNKFIGNINDFTLQKIILDIRMPRIILAALIGTGLSVTGTVFQGIFKNSMADPYVLGISSGSALGATISIVYKLETKGTLITTLCAFIGAILTIFIVYNISKIGNKIPTSTLLLAGIALNFFMSSLISISMILHREDIDRIVYWTMGSLGNASYKQVYFLAPIVIIITFIFYYNYRALNIIAVGEESAYILGIDSERFKKKMIFLSSIMVAAIVSVSGIIGFVGLIIPHIARLIVGANHREVIPFSMILGALFLIVCDAISRGIMPPTELPVGAVTSFFGAPYFMYLLWKKKRG
ncbi:FecCD family ABC transporter permease [Clostridium tepidum]|uniref:Iron ABC transporter n=1 Tax=Clostridium tepidum TaxID=1962263 RepID=A0A1S9I477_9CLOT|nr:iron ABC transporter permease [Clostridium tepidum]MCR1933307.1 iron ABC transporter permease [Clostridium tepidum]MDU6877468.1 iron ABC transporter permease [Clostridium botulinum]OOO62642.1 iron ABC transporter [Clostridium tepidum]OOO65080.1 iron ABC transporter [Clostridium tepidum]